MIAETSYNADIEDGLLAVRCVNNSSETISVDAKKYVRVRMVFGAETDERFDWTRFDVGGAAGHLQQRPGQRPAVQHAELWGRGVCVQRTRQQAHLRRECPSGSDQRRRHAQWLGVRLGAWYLTSCVTPAWVNLFDLPMTLTIYGQHRRGVRGRRTRDEQQGVLDPYRPSASSQCAGADAGKWYSPGLKTVFQRPREGRDLQLRPEQRITLPDQVVFGISYNTAHFGYDPTGMW